MYRGSRYLGTMYNVPSLCSTLVLFLPEVDGARSRAALGFEPSVSDFVFSLFSRLSFFALGSTATRSLWGLVGQGPWNTSGRPTAWKFLLLRMGLRLSLGGP